jgi:Amidohydrolase
VFLSLVAVLLAVLALSDFTKSLRTPEGSDKEPDSARDHGAIQGNPLPMRPSEYVRRQIFPSFQEDPVVRYVQTVRFENYMWDSDFPHSDSTWPDSRKFIERDLAGVSDDVKRKIVFANAANLYHLG